MADIQIGDVQGNALIAQIGGEMHGDLAARDKNVYHIQSLTIYASSRPVEPERKPISADIGPNPYKGLSAFQEEDADRFFGREQLTRLLWEKFCKLHELSSSQLTPHPPLFQKERGGETTPAIPPLFAKESEPERQAVNVPPLFAKERGLGGEFPLRLLAILGPSGSGKSSVARAGLLPELARNPLPGKQKARVAVFTPGAHPLEALATILARIATNDPIPVAKAREFADELRRATPSLQGREGAGGELPYDGLRRIADVLPGIDAAPLILLIDQFEEIYTQCAHADERQQFLDNLLCAAGDRSGHVSVILTLRSDFLGQTQSHPDFNHALAAHEILIPVMNDAELRQAIAEPAKQAGHPLDDATVALLIEQTKEREGALPLLQFALTKIWDG